jgi:site-specific DNA-methyltransferase (adenine-specific)
MLVAAVPGSSLPDRAGRRGEVEDAEICPPKQQERWNCYLVISWASEMDVPYKLYKGDCLEIMPQLEAGSVDAIITDLPYGTTACEWDSIIPLDEMWKQVKRVLKVNGVFVTTASQPFTSVLINSNLVMFKYDWKWNKKYHSNPFLSDKQPLRKVEEVCVFCEGVETYNPQMIKRPKEWMRDKPSFAHKNGEIFGSKGVKHSNSSNEFMYPSNLLEISIDNPNARDTQHPTQKPVALYEYLIRTYTNPNELILDICMGSGTTGVAAVQTGREFIGIEKERKYFVIAEKRIGSAHPPLFTEQPQRRIW